MNYIIPKKPKPYDEWTTNKIKDWRQDDLVCELLDTNVPRLIEFYIKNNYGKKEFDIYLEYSKSEKDRMKYVIERSIVAYDKMIQEGLIKRIF